MQRPLRNALLLIILASQCLACPIAWAETGILVVHVEDVQGHPVVGLEIGLKGDGGSAITDRKGQARVPLAPQTKENSSVSLQIVKPPAGQDLVVVSPWDYQARVPPFENESGNFVGIVVVQRGDLEALKSGTVLKAAVSQINKANAPKSADKQATPENPKANLEAVAKQYGLSPEDLDKHIRDWGAKTTDTYEAGLAALYARNYDKATTDLQSSLRQREEKLASDQKAATAVAADQKQVAEAAFFLGQSLYEQGKYKESAAAYQRCLQIRPDDATVLNNTAISLEEAGDYAGAEPLLRRALAIDEKALGPDHPGVATALNNLAALLQAKGDYVGAEPLFRQALAVDEKALGPDHPNVARDLNNLAALLQAKGDYAGAEPLFRRALPIFEKTLGPDHQYVATTLNDLAELLDYKGDYASAEPLMRRALAIDEKALGADHPDVATLLINLAGVLQAKSDYAGAAPLFRRALAIDEKELGPDHPNVGRDLNNLAELLRAKGGDAAAEPLYRRALAIEEKALGPDHPLVAAALNNLAGVLKAKGDYVGAEPLYRRALAIDEKALGANHPDVARDLNNLAELLEGEGDYAGAELLYRRALAICEKALGPDHPHTRLVQKSLDRLLQKSAQAAAPKAKS